MMTVRVSHLASFKRWLEDEESGIPALLAMLNTTETETMRKGTAFHKALEVACEQEADEIACDGYTFHFTGEFAVELPVIREQRRFKDYGGIIVTGQADGILGNLLIDYKSTETFDAERYLSGMQHKFYMDIFGLNRFRWYVFEMKEMDEAKHYCVHAMHKLEQYAYPGMAAECRQLAIEFRDFAARMGWPDIAQAAPSLNDKLRASLELVPA